MPTPPPRPRWALVALAVPLFGLMSSPASGQARPATTRAASLSRYIPATRLVVFVEFDGLDAHAAAWKKSAAYKLLNETKLGAMAEDLIRQGLNAALKTAPPGTAPKPDEMIGWIKAAVQGGFAFGVSGGKDPGQTVVVYRGGVKNGIRATIDSLDRDSGKQVRTESRGRRSLVISGDGTYWTEGDDLVMVLGPKVDVDAALATIDGKAPSATTHPIRTELARAEPTFEPAMVAFLDFASLPPPPPEAARLGFDGLKRIDFRGGFQDDSLYSVFRVLAPAPRRGVLALLDGPTFVKDALPAIPAGLDSFTVLSISPLAIFERYVALLKVSDPNVARGVDGFEAALRDRFKLDLRKDLLGPLGPKMVFYFGKVGAEARYGLTAAVHDGARFAQSLDKIMVVVNAGLAGDAAKANRPAMSFRKVAGGYELALPAGMAPPAGPFATVRPVILVGKTQLALGGDVAGAKKALDAAEGRGGKWTPGRDFAGAFAKLPGDLIALSVGDPRATMPEAIASVPLMLAALNAQLALNPNLRMAPIKVDPADVPTAAEIRARLFTGSQAVSLDRDGLKVVTREAIPSLASPATSAVAVALLLPAVQAAREAARRAQCVNNEKQIALALLNYESANNALPPAAIVGKGGKPLLSWRVAILPFIDGGDLHKEFHLDEPWDSPHNKALIPRMPTTFLCPSRSPIEPGTTTYRAFVGGGALFDMDKPTKLHQITDGTSNTLMLVEAKDAEIWTKPDDLAFDPKAGAPLLGAWSFHPGGFNALFVDGSVRFFRSTVDPATFRALITRAGGEVIQGPLP